MKQESDENRSYVQSVDDTADQDSAKTQRSSRLLLDDQFTGEFQAAILRKLGLRVALRSLVDDARRQEGMLVLYLAGRLPKHIHPEDALCLYRTAQETLENIARHASEARLRISLIRRRRNLTLAIRDFGSGFDPEADAAWGGAGPQKIRDRIERLGGFFRIVRGQSGGTLIWISIPHRALETVSRRHPHVQEPDASLQHGELYRLLVRDAQDVAIFLANLQGTIVSWNAGVRNILGYAKEEFVGQQLAFLSVPDEKAGEVHILANGSAPASSNRWLKKKDGASIYASCLFSTVRDENRQPMGVSVLVQDATAQHVSEKRHVQVTRLLQQSNEDLSRLGHILSHDLRAPLRMVGTCVEMLSRELDGHLDSASREFMDLILEGIGQMDGLILSLLSYAQADHPHVIAVGVNLSAVLEQTLSILAIAIRENGATVTFDALPSVQGDPVLLRELLQNLISNALKYRNGDPPQIDVSSREDETEWVVSVRDNGVGIDPQYAEKIFLPLTRLHGRQIPGSGIGLAVCKRVAERHGGRIWVESTGSAGSTFHFSLPKLSIHGPRASAGV